MATKKTEAENMQDVLAQAQEHGAARAEAAAQAAQESPAKEDAPPAQDEAPEASYDPTKHTMEISGRKYLPVAARISWFNDQNKAYRIATEPHMLGTDFAIFKTAIDVLSEGSVVRSVTAYGSETAKDFGDFIEKAETKSLGRALSFLGYGTPDWDDETAGRNGPRVVDTPRGGYSGAQGAPAASGGTSQGGAPTGGLMPRCSMGFPMRAKTGRNGPYYGCSHQVNGQWHNETMDWSLWDQARGVAIDSNQTRQGDADDLSLRAVFDTLKSIGGKGVHLRAVVGDDFTPQSFKDGGTATQQDWAVTLEGWKRSTGQTYSALMGMVAKAVQNGQQQAGQPSLADRLAGPPAQGGLVGAALAMGATPVSEPQSEGEIFDGIDEYEVWE